MEEQNGKRKKPWYKKWWVWLIIVVVIGAIGSNADVEEQAHKDKVATPTSANPDKNKEDDKAEEKNRTITEVGERIRTKNFRISLESFSKPKSDNMFVKPEKGKEFVSVGLLIENISEEDYTISSLLMFDAYRDGFSINESIMGPAAEGDEGSLGGSLAAGKKMRGSLKYEVPKGWKKLEINVDLTKSSFSTDGEFKIVLQNK